MDYEAAARAVQSLLNVDPGGEYDDHERTTIANALKAAHAAGMEDAAQICDSEATIEGIAQKCAAAIRKAKL